MENAGNGAFVPVTGRRSHLLAPDYAVAYVGSKKRWPLPARQSSDLRATLSLRPLLREAWLVARSMARCASPFCLLAQHSFNFIPLPQGQRSFCSVFMDGSIVVAYSIPHAVGTEHSLS